MPDVSDERLEENLAVHIFSVSAAMVGVCLTVIGIIRIVIAARSVETLADDVLALDALLFVAACLLAYSAIRSRSRHRRRRLERVADVLFLVALLLMAAACGLIAYALV